MTVKCETRFMRILQRRFFIYFSGHRYGVKRGDKRYGAHTCSIMSAFHLRTVRYLTFIDCLNFEVNEVLAKRTKYRG